MGLRPGGEGETGAEKKAYGASTLEGRHVVVDAVGNTRLQFVGKKGVNLDLPVTNPTLAKDLKERAEKVGENGKLFDTSDDNLRRYVKTLNGGGFKVKDFRTHLGTSTAADLVKAGKAPTTPAEYKRRVLEVAKSVSQILGNTPSIALASYINPVVFAGWKAVAGA
jgi:DNA topoisomerase-1